MQESAFLDAIIAHPDDDTHRLVYADWLDDYGDEDGRARAELIRAQCQLEQLPPADSRAPPLRRQVRRLLKDNAKHWTRALSQARLGSGWKFRRGFVEAGRLSARKFVRVAEQLFQLAPTLRAMHFPDASNEVAELAESPHLARLREVDLSFMCACGACPIGRELRLFFASPHVANLTTLNLAGNRIGADGAHQLASSPHLARLTTLNLADNSLGADGVRALAATRNLDRLVTLDLSRCALSTAGARVLAEARRLSALRSLALNGNAIGPLGGRALACSRLLGRLTSLDLSNNPLGNTGAWALARSERIRDVEVVLLDLRNNAVEPLPAQELRARFGDRVKL